ncbi:MAG: hypothetical protein ACLPIX_08515 [Rhodomicrobium sp.]
MDIAHFARHTRRDWRSLSHPHPLADADTLSCKHPCIFELSPLTWTAGGPASPPMGEVELRLNT